MNSKFKICFKTIISNIILPKVLIFSFDSEETNDNNSDYNIFFNNQPNIRKILEYNINKDLDAFNLKENLLYENNNNSISKKFILNNNLVNSLANIKEQIKDNENNNNKKEECDYKKRINWNMNSCRYDAFLFIYVNIIMNNLKNKSKNIYILCFNGIGEILLNINGQIKIRILEYYT